MTTQQQHHIRNIKHQTTNNNQATSNKQQATSNHNLARQATSNKQQETDQTGLQNVNNGIWYPSVQEQQQPAELQLEFSNCDERDERLRSASTVS